MKMNGSENANCSLDNDDDLALMSTISFWTEGIFEILICIVGLVGNCTTIPILLSAKMSSIFNRLLVFLTIFDNVFILCCILEAFRKYIYPTEVHQIIFIYFLFQVQNIALTCSIYATVVLATERFMAVSKPVEYHIMVNASGANPWKRVLAYMLPTIAFGILLNFPKFFELFAARVIVGTEKIWKADVDGIETYEIINKTRLEIRPTELRLNDDYVLYYVNWTMFFVTGIFPFLSLVFLNSRIYR